MHRCSPLDMPSRPACQQRSQPRPRLSLPITATLWYLLYTGAYVHWGLESHGCKQFGTKNSQGVCGFVCFFPIATKWNLTRYPKELFFSWHSLTSLHFKEKWVFGRQRYLTSTWPTLQDPHGMSNFSAHKVSPDIILNDSSLKVTFTDM